MAGGQVLGVRGEGLEVTGVRQGGGVHGMGSGPHTLKMTFTKVDSRDLAAGRERFSEQFHLSDQRCFI